jgi:hypothetical protein
MQYITDKRSILIYVLYLQAESLAEILKYFTNEHIQNILISGAGEYF